MKKLKKVTGYQVYVLTKKKGKKVLVRRFSKKAKFTIKSNKLKNKKKLFIKVRAYVMVGNRKQYGKWSKVKRIRIKK